MGIQTTTLGLISAALLAVPSLAAPPQSGKRPATRISPPLIVQPPPANKLDTSRIHATYLEGDFDPAIEAIEDARKYGGPFSHQDSIFMFKHLGVMYTAKYETREKGKQCMLALLEVEPTAKILDMYASDMIYMIFKNVQDEFEASNPHRLSGYRPNLGLDSARPARTRRYAWLGWTAGAAAAVGGGFLALHLLDTTEPGNASKHTTND